MCRSAFFTYSAAIPFVLPMRARLLLVPFSRSSVVKCFYRYGVRFFAQIHVDDMAKLTFGKHAGHHRELKPSLKAPLDELLLFQPDYIA